ncbi:Hypothetical predicted protein [Mytilus galloprovincialis]|uniref:Uncharacterized protein n=1 Tax=Mytilus galloprovincialis TaxID=29158 RepID=A0A8B6HEP0_MYTGA|nr:Hypothetical predicted protein [Mytilus galloprovincialis]
MSLAKLKKSYKRPIQIPTTPREFRPIVIGNSIGGRLRQQASLPLHSEIHWWCKGGRTVVQALDWLKQNLDTEVQLITGNIWLYIIIGTCDFTAFDRKTKYITLKYQNTEELVEHLVKSYKEIIQILKGLSPGSQATIVEIPYFSIEAWNKAHKHKNPETFRDQDHQLEHQLLEVNKAIRNTNQENQHFSPNFNIDLYRTSTRQQRTYQRETTSNRHGETKSRRLYNLSLLQDGIHPNIHLTKAWLMKLTRQITRDCWAKDKEDKDTDINNNS